VNDCTAWAYEFTPSAHYGSLSFGNDAESGDRASILFDEVELDATPNYRGEGAPTARAGASFTLNQDFETVTGNDDLANWCTADAAIGASGDEGTPFGGSLCTP